MEDRGHLCFITCDSGREFGNRVFAELQTLFAKRQDSENLHCIETQEISFANGEFKTVILNNIRGGDVYILQCMDDPLCDRTLNDNFMALITAIDAAYQSDAESVTAVIPQFPYSRQERKKEREGITARLVLRIMELAGANRVITLDVHAEAIQGFSHRCHMENLHASRDILRFFNNYYVEPRIQASGGRQAVSDQLVVVAPDVGSADRARHYSKFLMTDLAIIDKERDYRKTSVVTRTRLVGDVKGRDVFAVDDMISTGGTLLKACEHLKDKGAKDIYLACSLAFLNGNAIEHFRKAYENNVFKALIGTDAVFRGEEFMRNNPWYIEVSMASYFAQVIYNINKKLSVSELLTR